MLSRLLTNIILLVIVITLGVFIYISRDDPVDTQRLTQLDANSVTQISISHNTREVLLEKTAEHWRMLKPTVIDANDFRIKTLLDLLSTQSLASYAPDELELDKIGLAPARTSVQFNQLTIAFGIDNPINHNRYVLVDGRVHLISDQFYPLISSQLGTLVSQHLIARDAVITGIDLPEQTLRKSDIGWQSSDTTVSTDSIQKVIDQWQQAQAFGVHTYNPRTSLGHIEVSIDDTQKPLIFEITDTSPWLIIARPELNLEYHFNLEFYDRLLRPGADEPAPDDLLDANPATAPASPASTD